MRYLIGLWERAGESEGVLCTETGLVLRRLVGKDGADKLIPPLIRHMPLQKTAVYAALSREEDGRNLPALCHAVIPGEVTVQTASFTAALLNACFHTGETGAVLFMQGIAGAAARDGNSVYSVSGTAGSTAEIARAAIVSARGAWEKTAPPTNLTFLLSQTTGLSFPEIGDVEPHALCRLAWRGFRIRDAVCTDIIRTATDALMHYLETATGSLAAPVPLYLWDTGPENREIIKAATLDRFPGKFHIQFADMPPVLGSVYGAASLPGLSPGKNFLRCFAETYGSHL